MPFDEKKLSRKERKAIEAEEAREQAEWDAKMTASAEKKKIQKLIVDIDKAEKSIMENAAAAKSKGYADVYRQQVSALKIARARKMQAEKFLFQIDAMEKMKSISASSSELLNSMGSIMGTLGKLSLDKDEMRKTQQNFMKTQQNLTQQSQTIEQFFSRMEMCIPEDDDVIIEEDGGLMESNIENEIQAILDSQPGASAGDADVAKFQQLLGV